MLQEPAAHQTQCSCSPQALSSTETDAPPLQHLFLYLNRHVGVGKSAVPSCLVWTSVNICMEAIQSFKENAFKNVTHMCRCLKHS